MVNLLIFSRYTSLQASTRVRFLQFIPYLDKQGITVEVFSLLSDNSISTKHQFFKLLFFRFIDLVRAIKKLTKIKSNTKIHIYIELFPWLPFWLEFYLMNIFGIKSYSLEYDDAWFHRYDMHPNFIIKSMYKNKIAALMKHAQLVIVGNLYLANYARLSGAKNIEIIPTVVDLNHYPNYAKHFNTALKSEPVVVWIGTPSTVKYLQLIGPALQALAVKLPFILRVIGGGNVSIAGVSVEIVDWSEDTEAANLQTSDVGIMPLLDNSWEQGKCAYKLIQYMACGLPTVASAVGANKEVVLQAETGYLVNTDGEWVDALEKLLTDQDLRHKFGVAGRERVVDKYCVQVINPFLAHLFLRNKLNKISNSEINV